MLIYIYSLASLGLGLIVGSFLNVVIYRWGTGRTVLGRSECLSCGAVLAWRELAPVFSFLIQRGRCRRCRAKLSWQYPLVELLTGLLFATAFWLNNFNLTPLLLLDWAALSLLVVITVYDWRHKIIPNPLVWGFVALAFLRAFFFQPVAGFYPAILAGFGFFAFLGGLWLFSRGRWIGLGDAKLALGIGLFLGWPGAVSAATLAFWLGALLGLGLILMSRRFSLKSEVPFAPFLAAGFLLVYFFQIDVFELLAFGW